MLHRLLARESAHSPARRALVSPVDGGSGRAKRASGSLRLSPPLHDCFGGGAPVCGGAAWPNDCTRTSSSLTSPAASVVVRFFVGAAPPGARFVGGDDDAAELDVTALEQWIDAPENVTRISFGSLLRAPALAPTATHFLSLDDDAYPFLDRLLAELRAEHVWASPWTRPNEARVQPSRVKLKRTFVWGYFMMNGRYGPWPFPIGFAKLLTADLLRALAAANAEVELELAFPCSGYDELAVLPQEKQWPSNRQGACVKGAWINADNLLGLVLAPLDFQVVHDRRFHVVFPGDRRRNDRTPAWPVSNTSLVVDRHDLKEFIATPAFLHAMHTAARTQEYDALNLLPGCSAARGLRRAATRKVKARSLGKRLRRIPPSLCRPVGPCCSSPLCQGY